MRYLHFDLLQKLFFNKFQFFVRSFTVLHLRALRLAVVVALQRHKFVRLPCYYS
jgi:hypothetical protein